MMRYTIVSTLATIVTVLNLAAAAPEGAPVSDPEMSAYAKREVDWYQKMMVSAYDTVGHRDLSWDAPAREAIAAGARLWSKDPRSNGDERHIIAIRGETAAKAGCGDPLFGYVVTRNLAILGAPIHIIGPNHVAFAKDFIENQKHAAYFRCMGLLRGADYGLRAAGERPGDDVMEQTRKFEAAAMALVPEVVNDKDIPVGAVASLFEIICETGAVTRGDGAKLAAPALTILDKSIQPRSVQLSARGEVMIRYAWEARGSGTAGTVTQQGWKLFAQRLDLARTALEEAWKLDNTNAHAAERMITVCMGQSRPRPEMEVWFKRARDANPDSYEACERKLLYLEPKWHGSPQECIEFGQELLKEGRWRANMPAILIEAYWRVAEYAVEPREMRAFFEKNPQAAADAKAVYEGLEKAGRLSNHRRALCGIISVWSGQPKEAMGMLDGVDNLATRSLLPPRVYYDIVEEARTASGVGSAAPAKQSAADGAPVETSLAAAEPGGQFGPIQILLAVGVTLFLVAVLVGIWQWRRKGTA